MPRGLLKAILAATMVGGCGGSPTESQGEPARTPSGTTSGGGGGESGSESDLEAAARAHFQAFADDDDDAYFAGLSDSCRATAGYGVVSERNNTRQGRIRTAGIDMATITIADVEITAFTGSTASVALTLAGTDEAFLEEQPNPWVFEVGTWHWDNCDVFASSGGGNTGTEGSGPGNAIGVGFPTRIAGWYVYSTYLNANANELVAGSDGPAAPPSGTVFFTWGVTVKYDGPDASSTLSDVMAFRLVAGSTVYDDPSACGNYAAALDLTLVAAPGEGMPADICRAVAPGDVGSLFLVVTEKSTGTDIWFGQ
jgi:hypothetical protein